MRAKEFITEGYKEVKTKFSQNHDENDVNQYINKFKELVSKKQISDINKKNINYWGKKSFNDFKSFIDDFSDKHTKTSIKRKKVPGQSITLQENDQWLIVIPLDKEASCFHGKDSDWCTTKPTQSHFEQYFYDKNIILVYCLQKNTGNMWALAIHNEIDQIEIFDKKDNSISEEEFISQTKLSAQHIKQLIINNHLSDINSSKEKYKDAMTFLDDFDWYSISGLSNRNSDAEKALMITKENNYCTLYLMRLFKHNPDVVNDIPDPILRIGLKNFAPAFSVIHNKSFDFYKDTTNNYPDAWQYIPQSEITPELNKLKYKRWLDKLSKPFTIEYKENNPLNNIPPELKDYSVYLQFATNITFPTEFLQIIPSEFRSEELCNIAYEKDPRNIKYIPEQLKYKIENKESLDLLHSKNINTNGLSEQELRKILVDIYFKLDTKIPDDKKKQAYDALMSNNIELNTITHVIKKLESQ